jgi:KamA family protein
LVKEDFDRIYHQINNGSPPTEILSSARQIQMQMNPHPAGQMELNVPSEDGNVLKGMQHKYDETVLFFPSHGQTCHAYCTYCFRWAQFVGMDKIKFASSEINALLAYLRRHPEITDVLFTGGDPLTMNAKLLRRYIEPLLREKPGNLQTIRIGTKALAYWPYRFVTDKDSYDLLRLFEEVVDGGLHFAMMSHYSHPRELETSIAKAAIKKILNTGATIRCQAPLIRYVNDDPDIWASMWQNQVKLGAIPYYMFIARDTGPKQYFEISLAKALRIFSEAYRNVSGLCRTVRGPSMSATPGKVLIDGVAEIKGEKVFALKFIQGRNYEWVNRVFFARYDENASWLDQLVPAFGEPHFFFDPEMQTLKSQKADTKKIKHAEKKENFIPECA